MPADKEIDLGTIEVVRNFSTDYTTGITPMNATYAKDAAYYPEITSEKNFRAAMLAKTPDMLEMKVLADNADIANTGFSFTLTKDKDNKKETSQITLPKSASTAKYKTLVIKQPVKVFGVTYTYKLTVNYKDPETYSLMTNPIRVENNIATLGGTFKYGDMNTPKENFALESIDLSTFFYVDGHKGSTEELQVKYSRITYDNKGNEVKNPIVGGLKDVTASAVSIAPAPYAWPGNESSVIIRAELIMKNADFKFNSIDITLNAPEVIPTFKGLTANKEVVDGVDAEVKLFNYISVIDFKGTQLVCSEATTIANMWAWVDEEDVDLNGELNLSAFHKDCYLIYGQELTFADKSKLTIKHNGTVIDPSLVNFDYNKTAGTITLSKNNASLNGTITFEIPVKLDYIYNNGVKKPGTITVNYVRATDAE